MAVGVEKYMDKSVEVAADMWHMGMSIGMCVYLSWARATSIYDVGVGLPHGSTHVYTHIMAEVPTQFHEHACA